MRAGNRARKIRWYRVLHVLMGRELFVLRRINFGFTEEAMAEKHELPKTYQPADIEDRIYQNWCDKG